MLRGIARGVRRGPRPLAWPVPATLGWNFPYPIREIAPGLFGLTLNERALRRSTTEIRYVDVATGNNANTGLNPLLPKKSINAAINLWTNATIYVKAGTYTGTDAWTGGVPFGAEQNIIGVSDFTSLKPGRVISVGTAGAINGWLNTALSITVENITFSGGFARAFFLQNAGTVTFIDCAFTNSETLAGLSLSSNAAGVPPPINLIRCRAYLTTEPGSAAPALGAGPLLRWLEWDCEGSSNGNDASTNQGSSIHKAAGNGNVAVVRIGGRYLYNQGPQNIADVGGVNSLNMGVTAYGLLGGGGLGTSFYAGNATQMWLHGCTAGGAIDMQTDAVGGTIRYYSSIVSSRSGPGNFVQYTPPG